MLSKNGVLILEFPYLVDLIENLEFDTIYHEHLSYFAVKPLIRLFKNFGLVLFDVQKITVHGGSIRIFVKKADSININVSPQVKSLLILEKQKKLDSINTYNLFAQRVVQLKKSLFGLLENLKSQNKRIAGDGAPAKGNTLLNYCGINNNLLDYIVEMSPLKIGLYTPGTHIPILPIEKIYTDKPDFLLILPWNIKNDIMLQQRQFKNGGGQFIVPIPSPQII